MITAVGSLRNVKLRLANASKKPMSDEENLTKSSMGGANEIREWKDERFEIVSLVGTFSRDGSCHLHLSIADANGCTFGGHLIEGEVFTTAEVVLGSAGYVEFPREFDRNTGYKELVPKQIPICDTTWRKELMKMSIAVFIGFSMGVSFMGTR